MEWLILVAIFVGVMLLFAVVGKLFKGHAKKDPLTGDMLDLSDRFSFRVQGIFRRWGWVAALCVVSFVWWSNPTAFHDDSNLAHWNVGASLMAIVIESVVGIGMFSQTKRDAVIIRDVHKVTKQLAAVDDRLKALEDTGGIPVVQAEPELHHHVLRELGELRKDVKVALGKVKGVVK